MRINVTGIGIIKAANKLIPRPVGKTTRVHKNGNTQDIINTILAADKKYTGQLAVFAPMLIGNSLAQTLNNNWQFVKQNFVYEADDDSQNVKAPAAAWAEKIVDCKSYTLFLVSLLKGQLTRLQQRFPEAKGMQIIYRFAGYNGATVAKHVYAVVKLQNGKQYILDCCLDDFNKEKLPTTYKQDFMSEINMVTGVGYTGRRAKGKGRKAPRSIFSFGGTVKTVNTPKGRDTAGLKDLTTGDMDVLIGRNLLDAQESALLRRGATATATGRKQLADIRAAKIMLGDAQAAFEKYKRQEKIEGIGNAADLDDTIEGIGEAWDCGDYYDEGINGTDTIGASKRKAKREQRKADKKAGKAGVPKKKTKVGKFLQKAAQAVKKGAKAVVKVVTAPARLAAKGILEASLPKAAPRFLYLFITDPAILAKMPKSVIEKRKKQEKIANFIIKGIGMKQNHFMGILRAGILKQKGKSPEALIADLTKGRINGVGGIGLVDDIVGIIQDIIKFFKGKKGQVTDKDIKDSEPSALDFGSLAQSAANAIAVQVQNAAPTPAQQLENVAAEANANEPAVIPQAPGGGDYTTIQNLKGGAQDTGGDNTPAEDSDNLNRLTDLRGENEDLPNSNNDNPNSTGGKGFLGLC